MNELPTNGIKSLVEILTEQVEGLFYPSESDEKIKIIDWQADNIAPFDLILFRKYIGVNASEKVEVIPWELFFQPVLEEAEWWTDYEKERAAQFSILKETVVSNLSDLTFFRVGKVEIEIYLLGRDKEGKWKGLKSLIIET